MFIHYSEFTYPCLSRYYTEKNWLYLTTERDEKISHLIENVDKSDFFKNKLQNPDLYYKDRYYDIIYKTDYEKLFDFELTVTLSGDDWINNNTMLFEYGCNKWHTIGKFSSFLQARRKIKELEKKSDKEISEVYPNF